MRIIICSIQKLAILISILPANMMKRPSGFFITVTQLCFSMISKNGLAPLCEDV